MNRAYLRPPFAVFQILAALLSPLLIWTAVNISVRRMPDLQQIYFWDYLKASVVPELPSLQLFGPKKPKPPHTEVMICYVAQGHSFPVTGTLDYNLHPQPVVLPMSRAKYAAWLQRNIYDGKPPIALLVWPVMLGVLLGSIVYGLAWRLDQERHLKFRGSGRQLRGPELVSVREFRHKVKGDGVAIRLDGGRRPWQPRELRIQQAVETQHVQVIGDSGSGKTSLILGLLDQAEAAGESCVIYDPHREYMRRYYSGERGDVILGLDDRAEAWNPSAEIDWSSESTADATATALSESLYPGHPGRRDWFFTSVCRDVMKYCIVHHRPNAAELAHLYTHAKPLIDSIVKGTALEETLKENTSGTRPSIMGTLTTNILPMLLQIRTPCRSIGDNRSHWDARTWVKHRKGWIFLTSTQETRESSGPLQRLWIDSVIRGILSMGPQPNLPQVRMILDELWALGELSQLKSAVAEGRKAALSIVLGFQGRAQVKEIYGDSAESIFSAPYTKILLRTGEPESAEWLAKMIGKREMERIREHRGDKGKRTYTTEQREEWIVYPSELAALENRCGYLRYADYVVRLKVAIAPPRGDRAAGWIPRAGKSPAILPMPNLQELVAQEEAERQKQSAKAAAYVYDPMANRAKRAKRGPGGQEGLWNQS